MTGIPEKTVSFGVSKERRVLVQIRFISSLEAEQVVAKNCFAFFDDG
jgi:hypothetical protein